MVHIYNQEVVLKKKKKRLVQLVVGPKISARLCVPMNIGFNINIFLWAP